MFSKPYETGNSWDDFYSEFEDSIPPGEMLLDPSDLRDSEEDEDEEDEEVKD